MPLLVIALSGCFPSEPQRNPPSSPPAFQDLLRTVVQWRGLPAKREIRLNLKTVNDAASAGSEFARLAPDLERAYKVIGLLANDVQTSQVLSEYHRLSRLIDYDHATGVLSLAPEAAQLGAPLEKTNPSAARDLPIAIGVALALQEQNFNWRERSDSITNEDRRGAFHAFAVGDAVFTALSADGAKDSGDRVAARLSTAIQIAAEIDRLAARLPDYLRRRLTLPYGAGSQFVYWAFKAQGKGGINSLYSRPPLSTAEILHPEIYFNQRAVPLIFFPPALLRRYEKNSIVEQTLGEDAIAGLLAHSHTANSAETIAAGWRGDRLFAFGEGSNLATAWFSSWGSERQAREFLQAYRRVIETRHRVRFGVATAPVNTPWIASAHDQRGWLLQSQGSVVLLVSAARLNRLAELANDAWQDLEIDKETRKLRFDEATVRRQRSVVRR